MIKIVFLDAQTLGSDISLLPISSLGEYMSYPYTLAQDVNERIKDCDVLIINKVQIGKEQIDAAKNLKLICVAATGTNNVDSSYAALKNIPVKNAVGYSTESVSQVTFSLLLSLVGKIPYFNNYVKSKQYTNSNSFTDISNPFQEIKGKRMGIIGLGNIGKRVAEIASVFGMEVVYYSSTSTPRTDKYKMLGLEELMQTSDIISIHSPLNSKTTNLISYKELSLAKPSSYIINMGRGGIIVEEDLVKALNNNIIAGAAVDVYTTEPFPSTSPFFNVKDSSKILLSPHIGWASKQARIVLVDKIAENIKISFPTNER